MELKLHTGMTTTEHVRVDNDRSIAFMGEALRMYSTPSMVSDVEYACLRLIQKHLRRRPTGGVLVKNPFQ